MMNVSLLFTLVMVGVFLAVLWAGTRVLIAMFGWVLGGLRPKESHRGGSRSAGVICPNRQCRRANLAEANFCAQCGTALRDTYS